MKINLKNVCYPKPLLSKLISDYKNNDFTIIFTKQEYDKENQKLLLNIETQLNNNYIKKLIVDGKVAVILHLEQKTQREPFLLNSFGITEKSIDLYKYATTDPIEVVGILYCIEGFKIDDKGILNDVYKLLNDEIIYERGDIIGFSNELQINLPEDKRIGSIFNLIPDRDNILEKGQPFSVSLNSDLIQIIMQDDLHEKYIRIYKNDPYVKKMMFSNIVYPSIVSAYTEMFISYDQYKEKKWCVTLANKVEKKLKLSADEIFIKDNYELEKVYLYANYALGELFKDSIDTYGKGMGV